MPVETERKDGVVTDEESAKLIALIKDFMAEAVHWSLATYPACKRTVPVSSLKGAARRFRSTDLCRPTSSPRSADRIRRAH